MRYAAGTKVGRGFYWNPKTFEQINVREGEQVLPGAVGTVFLKLPWPFLIVIGPLLGLALVMFLPVIGIVLTGQILWTTGKERYLSLRGLRLQPRSSK
jgi:hypothetical protein